MTPLRYALLGVSTLVPPVSSAWIVSLPHERLAAAAPFGGLAALAGLTAVFFLMAHAARTNRPVAWQGAWIAALAVASVVAAPVYWALYVRPAFGKRAPATA